MERKSSNQCTNPPRTTSAADRAAAARSAIAAASVALHPALRPHCRAVEGGIVSTANTSLGRILSIDGSKRLFSGKDRKAK